MLCCGKSRQATDIPALEEPTRRCCRREQGGEAGEAPRRLLGSSA